MKRLLVFLSILALFACEKTEVVEPVQNNLRMKKTIWIPVVIVNNTTSELSYCVIDGVDNNTHVQVGDISSSRGHKVTLEPGGYMFTCSINGDAYTKTFDVGGDPVTLWINP